MRGVPATGIGLRLYRLEPEETLVATACTNADGRCDEPLLSGSQLTSGRYRLEFTVGEYFAGAGVAPGVGSEPFLDRVPVEFYLSGEAAHYHIPLLVSPHGYTTYRGS